MSPHPHRIAGTLTFQTSALPRHSKSQIPAKCPCPVHTFNNWPLIWNTLEKKYHSITRICPENLFLHPFFMKNNIHSQFIYDLIYTLNSTRNNEQSIQLMMKLLYNVGEALFQNVFSVVQSFLFWHKF